MGIQESANTETPSNTERPVVTLLSVEVRFWNRIHGISRRDTETPPTNALRVPSSEVNIRSVIRNSIESSMESILSLPCQRPGSRGGENEIRLLGSNTVLTCRYIALQGNKLIVCDISGSNDGVYEDGCVRVVAPCSLGRRCRVTCCHHHQGDDGGNNQQDCHLLRQGIFL